MALDPIGAIYLASAGLYLHTTLRGKRAEWARLLDGLALRGDERVLDIGCGRGVVLNAAARRVPRGRAIGVDIWRARDQNGNDPGVTMANAAGEGVAERVEIATADMTDLPFEDGSFDLVVSSVAIHNVSGASARAAAVAEAYRVTAPDGRLVLVDLFHTGEYAAALRQLGAEDVRRRPLGWRCLWGPLPSMVVTARR